MDYKAIYERVYAEHKEYGSAKYGRCPGVRWMPEYIDFIESPIIDIGCGRGDTVKALRDIGLEANGVDIVDFGNGEVVGDITMPIDINAKTALCLDVLEHIHEDDIDGVLSNLSQSEKQVISVHTGLSPYWGGDLHTNIKTFDEWEKLLSERFEIIEKKKMNENVMLFLSIKKADLGTREAGNEINTEEVNNG